MINRHILAFALVTLLTSAYTVAQTPVVGGSLPALAISDKGEITVNGDDHDFIAWDSSTSPGKVHVIQYFGATLGDRDIFAPFTDLLQESFEDGAVHVTTVLNLDAAMWGTKGMVMSELKKNKAKHPEATIVADADGDGVKAWGLGKKGTGLIILDTAGKVLFFSPSALKEDELAPTIELIRANMGE